MRKLGSRLEGHPTPLIPWVDVATGSLGQGLPIGVGMALAGKYLDRLPYRVWVLLRRQRDGRGLGLGGVRQGRALQARQPDRHPRHEPARPARARPTLGWNTDAYAARARAFGWHAIEIDGHDLERDRRAPTPRPPSTDGAADR